MAGGRICGQPGRLWTNTVATPPDRYRAYYTVFMPIPVAIDCDLNHVRNISAIPAVGSVRQLERNRLNLLDLEGPVGAKSSRPRSV